MSFDVKTFRRALGCFATGITVVTAANAEGGPALGITINSFTSLSLDPPLVLFCLGRNSLLYRGFTGAAEYAINILAEDQGPLSTHFSGPATQRNWGTIAVTHTAAGTPLLAGCVGHLVCTAEAVHDGGDHVIMVGRVQSLDWQAEGHPLLYFRGRYARLGELFVPLASAADMASAAESAATPVR